jgi:hypothetical protein
MFNPGDKIRRKRQYCGSTFEYDDIHTVARDDGQSVILVNSVGGYDDWASSSFELAEPQPYALQRKDIDLTKHEILSIFGNYTVPEDAIHQFPNGWFVVRDKPQPVSLADKITELTGVAGLSAIETQNTLIAEGYATEYPQ